LVHCLNGLIPRMCALGGIVTVTLYWLTGFDKTKKFKPQLYFLNHESVYTRLDDFLKQTYSKRRDMLKAISICHYKTWNAAKQKNSNTRFSIDENILNLYLDAEHISLNNEN